MNRAPMMLAIAGGLMLGLFLASRGPSSGERVAEAVVAAPPSAAPAQAAAAPVPQPVSAPTAPARVAAATPAPAPTPAPTAAAAGPAAFTPPPRSAIPAGPLGDMIREGEAIFRDTGAMAPHFVGNALACSNCHIDAGRLADAAPMWAAWVAFPAYRSKNGHVNTFEERLQGCFRFSMNGKAPKLGDKVLVALETYAAWLATNAPTGAKLAGRGYVRLPSPAEAPDDARGKQVFAQNCALCHGAHGEGQFAGGKTVFPPLWGPKSYNWGAGMTSVAAAAGFIKANMPLGRGDSLTDQQAWDVAMYLDSHDRPQDPRFTGNVEETRKRFHDSKWSMYGRTVNGVVLGANSPPAATTQ
jgi:thiosulfate dehydrogenase